MSQSAATASKSALGRIAKHDQVIFFCCDVQERFRKIIDRMPHVINVTSLMTKVSKTLGIPMVVTEQYPEKLGKTVEEVSSIEGFPTVVEKFRFSMVTEEVQKIMDAHKDRKTAVMFGIEAHVCVQQTTLDLLAKGYDVHVLADGVSSQRTLDRSVALRRMEKAGAFLTTSESLVFEILQDAKSEHFRAVSALIKDQNLKDVPELISSL
uniref:Isochorismatase-like domain-containing protein n=1 Tax=Chromera velia CCMP2878 TaxID=1169474 RepID=A0A0G4GN30_9ALVE|eukprot:Cvel_22611.t1-p1 / transcript=Cvel_22611.t1 / gene=Cvel_22611 / organism=Chromera_velia_CCMP2878 / gene_product=Isochorismatase domain-containing protein 1, putative / transcript_product=Isochorismatase domain-containing protein 1, putative / location=Cvel_scaffold2239:16036-20027(-) / protein_length=208 / sequence_SO=supercontig / SO=protein_coding / is_pseudo=false